MVLQIKKLIWLCQNLHLNCSRLIRINLCHLWIVLLNIKFGRLSNKLCLKIIFSWIKCNPRYRIKIVIHNNFNKIKCNNLAITNKSYRLFLSQQLKTKMYLASANYLYQLSVSHPCSNPSLRQQYQNLRHYQLGNNLAQLLVRHKCNSP
jgi:hypothetical protein